LTTPTTAIRLLLLPVPYGFAASSSYIGCVLGLQQGLFDISRRKHSKLENELYCTLKMSKLKVVCYGVGLGGLCSKIRPLCYAPMLPTTSLLCSGLGTVILFH